MSRFFGIDNAPSPHGVEAFSSKCSIIRSSYRHGAIRLSARQNIVYSKMMTNMQTFKQITKVVNPCSSCSDSNTAIFPYRAIPINDACKKHQLGLVASLHQSVWNCRLRLAFFNKPVTKKFTVSSYFKDWFVSLVAYIRGWYGLSYRQPKVAQGFCVSINQNWFRRAKRNSCFHSPSISQIQPNNVSQFRIVGCEIPSMLNSASSLKIKAAHGP